VPVDKIGQMITFAVEVDTAQTSPIRYVTKQGDTYAKVAAARGHPELAAQIAQMNKPPASVSQKLGTMVSTHVWGGKSHRGTHQVYRPRTLKIPGVLSSGDSFSVLADDPPPNVKAGYATYDVVNRPGRIGVSRFTGYQPIAIDIPIQWDAYAWGDGRGIEAEIQTLEKMAGVTPGAGGRSGPPPVIRISVTGTSGQIVPLIPSNYQWSSKNRGAPLYRISNITWDNTAGAVLRTNDGYRIRQKAVVEVTEYTPLSLAMRSVTQRAKAKAKPKAKK
jgi:hypothetical protein